MTKVVSLINMKGGVGKSTLSVNLAWHLAAYSNWNKKVLVIDLDPQFNASQYLVGVNKYNTMLEDDKPTTWDIFEQHTRTPGNKSSKKIKAEDIIRNVVRYRGGANRFNSFKIGIVSFSKKLITKTSLTKQVN